MLYNHHLIASVHSRIRARCSQTPMGGCCSESVAWLRVDCDEDVRSELRQTVKAKDGLSINVLEFMGTVATTWAFVVRGANTQQHARKTIFMRGDNLPGDHWVNHCRGGIEPQSRTLMRIVGCLEIGSGWCFQATHAKGTASTLGTRLSRESFYGSPPNFSLTKAPV